MVALSSDDRTLMIVSAKGLGSGPNGGPAFVDPERGASAGDVMQGTLQVVPVPDAARLAAHTSQVVENTYVARRGTPSLPPIRHVVFIVKENRTFDQVYGQRRGVRGDPTMADLGVRRRVRSKD